MWSYNTSDLTNHCDQGWRVPYGDKAKKRNIGILALLFHRWVAILNIWDQLQNKRNSRCGCKIAFVLLSEAYPLISVQLWIVRPPSRTIRTGPMSRSWVYLTSLILFFIPIRQPAVAVKGIQDPETRRQVLLSYHCHTYITRTCVVPVFFFHRRHLIPLVVTKKALIILLSSSCALL